MTCKRPDKTVLYAQSVYGEEEINAVVDVLENDSLALMNGNRVKEFERRVADLFGKTHGNMVNSGSSANMLAVSMLNLEPGDEVITPALTFSTTVAPLVQNRLVPVFVDVEEDTFVVDINGVENLIGPKTRALMIPNLIGNIADWRGLRALADRHNLVLIEDSCDTIGYKFNGGTTGRLSDIATTSFYASHVITAAGFGGMVMVNDGAYSECAKLLRGWGRRSSRKGESESIESRFHSNIGDIPYDDKFLFDEIGYNFLPSEISAAFGLVQLARLQSYMQIRKTNFEVLVNSFKEFSDWFILPRQSIAVETAWLAVPLIVRDSAPFQRRDLQIFFESHGIQTRAVFTGNVLRQPGFQHIERREVPGGYPHADQVMRGGILIGCHQGMGEQETGYIRSRFLEFAGRH